MEEPTLIAKGGKPFTQGDLEYLLAGCSGFLSVCLCSSVIGVELWAKEAHRLRASMPSHISKALDRCEQSLRPRKPPESAAKPARSLTQKKIDCRARILGFMSRVECADR
jgi:hypothetical protein